MLNHRLIHPKLNEILGRAGHYGKVLIADGHYPCSTTLGPNAELVSLNLAPGLVDCSQVLEVLLSAIPVETANTMDYDKTGPHAQSEEPTAWADYRRIFSEAKVDVPLEPIEKLAFYETVRTPEHVLTVQTADTRKFANLLLTIGVRKL